MAEVYTKGTRIWIADKDQGWISAEVTQATPGAAGSVKLQFIDDRGKVRILRFYALPCQLWRMSCSYGCKI